MKLKSITLNNFKGMDNIEFSLDQKTTVIFGINGVGKSTILKAIDLLYANIIAKLTKKKTKRILQRMVDFCYYRI